MTLIRCSLILGLITALAACGFQLRGSDHPLHKTFPSVNLVIEDKDPAFRSAMEQTLADARIEINEASANRLEVIETREQKRTASYSSRAKSAEYELIKSVKFRFSRERDQIIAPMKLEARRSYLYRETAAVGKAEEETLLKQEMNRDLAQRILLALLRAAEAQREQTELEATR